jgi:DNA polymerase
VPSCFRVTPKKVGAFQAEFELLGLQALRRRFPDFAEVPFGNFDDVRVRAKVLALPAKLETVGAALGLTNSKPAGSQRLVLFMARTPDAPPNKIAQLIERCEADTAMEAELHAALPELTQEMRAEELICHEINMNGAPIDLDLAHAGRDLIQQLIPGANAKIAKATAGEINNVNQVGKLLAFAREHGYRGRSLRKDIVEQHFPEADECGQEVLTLRRDNGSASVRKIEALIARTCADGRARGSLDFSKAGTGRDSSSGVQFQNLRRISSSDRIEEAIDIVLRRDLKRLKKFSSSPVSTIGSLIRPMVASKDGELIISDFASNEPRCSAQIAGETRLLDQFAKFDATKRPEHEPYTTFASETFNVPAHKVTPEQRQLSKTAFLSFTYMGGIRAWRNILPDTLSDHDVLRLRDRWRAAHPKIVRTWYRLNRAAILAVKRPGELVKLGLLELWSTESFLFLQLPSGRRIAYPFPSIIKNNFGEDAVSFYDNAAGKWVPCRFGQGAYGGTFFENAVQGTARDLLYHALAAIHQASHKICLHVHDEIVVEAGKGTVDLNSFTKLMVRRPKWALNLPISAQTFRSIRYIK